MMMIINKNKGIELKPEVNHKAIGQVKVSSHKKKVDILDSFGEIGFAGVEALENNL